MQNGLMKNSKKAFYEIVIIICLTIIFIAAFFDIKKSTQTADFADTQAVCTDQTFSRVSIGDDTSTKYYNCKLQFSVDSIMYNFEVESASIKIGDVVNIKYNPMNPNEAYLVPSYVTNIIIIVILLAFIIGAICKLKSKKVDAPKQDDKLARDVVNTKIVKSKTGKTYQNENKKYQTLSLENKFLGIVAVDANYSKLYDYSKVELECTCDKYAFSILIKVADITESDGIINDKSAIEVMLTKCQGFLSNEVELDLKRKISTYVSEKTYKDVEEFCDKESSEYISIEKYEKMIFEKGEICNWDFYFNKNYEFDSLNVEFSPLIDNLGDFSTVASFNSKLEMIDVDFID